MNDAAPSGLDRTVAAPASALEQTEAATEGPVGGRRRDDDEVLRRGQLLGRYVIGQVLGVGGMGTVYAAYDPDLDRKVAIKLLHRRVAQRGPGGPQRLLREAQAMARLTHPAVVTVHDVGVVGDQLFVAMELIDGVDLRRWLAEAPRSWRAAVEVLVAAGEGLRAAHDAGLVHRDFKPDNVLLARSGRICVADFGLAAAFAEGPEDAGEAPSSRSWLSRDVSLTAGAILGTPAYMAPEQFEGATVGPAADLFALCVTLWEAVYGARPFVGDTVMALREAVIAGRIAAPPDRGAPRRLERILRRGLSPRPEERPPSIDALLVDLRGLLRSRSRLFVGAGAIGLAIAGAAWIGAASAGAPRCEGADAAIAEVWSPAARDALDRVYRGSATAFGPATAERARAALDEVAGAWARGRVDACEATHLRGEYSEEVLDRRSACFDRQLGELRRLIAFLTVDDRQVIEHAVAMIHDFDGPEACAADEVLRAEEEPEPSPERAQLREAIERARLLHGAGKYREAVESLTPVIARLRELDAPRERARALAAASHSAYVDDQADAAARLDEALRAAIEAGDDRLFASVAADYLGLVRADAQARDLWRGLAEAALERGGGNDSILAKILTNYAAARRGAGDTAEAEALEREVLAIRRRSGASPELIADALYNLGIGLALTPRTDEAKAAMDEAIALWTEHLGPQHPRLAVSLRHAANLAMIAGKYDDAADKAERALELARALRGEGHIEVGMSILIRAAIANWRGDLDAARDDFEGAQTIVDGTGPKRKTLKALIAVNRASLDVDRREWDHAAAMLDRAAEILGDAEVDRHWLWHGIRLYRAEIALGRGDRATFEAELEIAEGLFRGVDDQPVDVTRLGLLLAERERGQGRPAAALERLAGLEAAEPRSFVHPYIRALRAVAVARARRDLGDRPGAEAAAAEALTALDPLTPGFAGFRAEIEALQAELARSGR
ncbi:MAG: serine/threonine-protein kinase [Nannocystaceae bacterium]